jgi:hypothetical protein
MSDQEEGVFRPRTLFATEVATAQESPFLDDYSSDDDEDTLELMSLTAQTRQLRHQDNDTTPLLRSSPRISPLRHRSKHDQRRELRRSPSSSEEDDLDRSLHDPVSTGFSASRSFRQIIRIEYWSAAAQSVFLITCSPLVLSTAFGSCGYD